MSNVKKDEQEVDSAEFARILTKQVNVGVARLHVARTVASSLVVVGKSLFSGFRGTRGEKSEGGWSGEREGEREKVFFVKQWPVVARERLCPAHLFFCKSRKRSFKRYPNARGIPATKPD